MRLPKHKVPLPGRIKYLAIRSAVIRILLLLATYAAVTYSFFIRSDMIRNMEMYTAKSIVMMMILFALGYVLPLFIFDIPRLIFERDFEGRVVEVQYKRILKASAGLSYPMRYGFSKDDIRILVRAKVHFANGKEEWCNIRAYDLNDPCVDNLVVGNFVRHYKWCKYTQIIYPGFRHDVDCVMCGMYTRKENDRCSRCGEVLIKGEEVYY